MTQREIKFRRWTGVEMYYPHTNPMDEYELADLNEPAIGPWMQYTGIKDKNGREICEGDIVEADGMLPSAVIFYESAFRTEPAADPLSYDAERYGGFTVIGNIYESSELLTK